MNRFFKNLVKYKDYIAYSAQAYLRADVSGSFLNWLWWILDPFLFMSVYVFMALVVFGRGEPHFIAFVFIGYGTWQYISRCIKGSVKLVRRNRGVLARIYLPKYILLFSVMYKFFIQYLITLGLSFFVAILDGVQFSWLIVYIPVIVLSMTVVTFGVCCICLHIGVYAQDFDNITTIVMRLLFYMSGVFYSLPNRIPKPFSSILLVCNPAAVFINEMRNVFLYRTAPNLFMLGGWLIAGILLSALGVHLIHKHEQNYVKAI